MAVDPVALALFESIGLDAKTAANAASNPKINANLTDVVHEAPSEDVTNSITITRVDPAVFFNRAQAGVEIGCDKSVGTLLYTVATKFPANALQHRADLCRYISQNQIKTIPQVEAALGFFALVGAENSYDVADFQKKCGVGGEASPAEIKESVASVINVNKDLLLKERYDVNVAILLSQVRTKLPWADGKLAQEELQAQMKALLGRWKAVAPLTQQ